jgi:diguanylate cyclase (GGDEF)-like protein
MEGFDRDWIAADPTRRLLRYTNLPPGRLTLLLRGSNRDGVWAPARRIRILVLPTWYQKAWFRILAAIAMLFGLFGIFLLATAYMRRQQRELERQVALRTAELEQKTVELKQSQQKLEHMAYTDSLTGLPNRRMFTEHFRRLLALKRRQQGTFALLLMDFDDFKSINDTYGHDAGDAVLKEMANRMSALVRESDCLARLGGDEYGLILGQSPDAEATEMVCQKIIESFAEPILFRGAELRTSPSIGVALYPADGKTQDKLYKTADLALYDAKRSGGNSYAWSPGSAPQALLQ